MTEIEYRKRERRAAQQWREMWRERGLERYASFCIAGSGAYQQQARILFVIEGILLGITIKTESRWEI